VRNIIALPQWQVCLTALVVFHSSGNELTDRGAAYGLVRLNRFQSLSQSIISAPEYTKGGHIHESNTSRRQGRNQAGLLVVPQKTQKEYSIGSALVSSSGSNHLHDGFSPFCRIPVVFAPNSKWLREG
jgi:hypothetical protein